LIPEQIFVMKINEGDQCEKMRPLHGQQAAAEIIAHRRSLHVGDRSPENPAGDGQKTEIIGDARRILQNVVDAHIGRGQLVPFMKRVGAADRTALVRVTDGQHIRPFDGMPVRRDDVVRNRIPAVGQLRQLERHHLLSVGQRRLPVGDGSAELIVHFDIIQLRLQPFVEGELDPLRRLVQPAVRLRHRLR